ncbi:hypothetical protein [Ralstonia phage RSP15]|uniref:hypothetical protein n=1 Tax=Ralstonia phage RSP15 TaxID=1785960 RepID=UPI00074D4918|nr:hypothetical protein BH754_gp077 [Ralstonia phage RSP15]BAU40035.1 hypothetical protein [Ralstonia phage RSP15]
MGLPSSGAISMADIANEIGKPGTVISLNTPIVAGIAGKQPTEAVIMPNDFWSKYAKFYGPLTTSMGSGTHFGQMSASFGVNGLNLLGGVVSDISNRLGVTVNGYYQMKQPVWRGSIRVTNVTSGQSVVLDQYVVGSGGNPDWWQMSSGSVPNNFWPTLNSGQSTTITWAIDPIF